MSLFLCGAWIEETICKQLRQSSGTEGVAHIQVPSHAQITEVIRQRKDGSFEVCVSDSKHFIIGVLANDTVDDFHREIDCEIRDIKGCYIVVDKFYYDFCYELGKFLIYIQKFIYCGGECDTYGDPVDVNNLCFLRSLRESALYTPMVTNDLFIHRSAIEGDLRYSVLNEQYLCGKRCSICNRILEGQEIAESRDRKDSEDTMPFRYNPNESLDDAYCSFDSMNPESSGLISQHEVNLCLDSEE